MNETLNMGSGGEVKPGGGQVGEQSGSQPVDWEAAMAGLKMEDGGGLSLGEVAEKMQTTSDEAGETEMTEEVGIPEEVMPTEPQVAAVNMSPEKSGEDTSGDSDKGLNQLNTYFDQVLAGKEPEGALGIMNSETVVVKGEEPAVGSWEKTESIEKGMSEKEKEIEEIDQKLMKTIYGGVMAELRKMEQLPKLTSEQIQQRETLLVGKEMFDKVEYRLQNGMGSVGKVEEMLREIIGEDKFLAMREIDQTRQKMRQQQVAIEEVWANQYGFKREGLMKAVPNPEQKIEEKDAEGKMNSQDGKAAGTLPSDILD